jgi:hypothetical protein
MKKKNLKPIIISALLAVGFGATSVGTSFALFTDRVDTTISVTAGKVDVSSTLELYSVSSLNASTVDTGTAITDTAKKNATFQNGGTAAIVDNVLTVQKLTPGDKAVLKLSVANESNVNIKYMLDRTITSLLINDAPDTSSAQLGQKLKVKVYSDSNLTTPFNLGTWSEVVGTTAEMPTLYIEVAFPDGDNSLIKFDDENNDNAYQSKKAVISFDFLAVQGNAVVQDVERVYSYYAGPSLATFTTVKVDQYGTETELPNVGWSDLIGDGDSAGTWHLNTETGEYETPLDVGVAKAGETIYLAAGVYDSCSGHLLASKGITIVGASQDSTIIHAKDSFAFNGDLTLKNLTILNKCGSHALHPNYLGLSSGSTPTRDAAWAEMDYLLTMNNVTIKNDGDFNSGYFGISAGRKLQLNIDGCRFENLRVGIGSVSKTSANQMISITNTTFVKTGEAIGYNHSEYYPNFMNDVVSNSGNVGLHAYNPEGCLTITNKEVNSSNYDNYCKARNGFAVEDLSNMVAKY